MAKADKMTEGFIFGKLKKRYQAPEWALFSSVQNSTGFRRSREADAVAMGTWPSRGMEVHGFEIKISRADWMRELRNPKKSEAIQKYCDRWWVVVSDKSFVNVEGGELPPTWGLMALKGSKLYTIVEAPKLQPQPLDRGFIAAVLRRAHESAQDPDVEAKVRGELQEDFEKWKKNYEMANTGHLARENERLKSEIEFLRASAKISNQQLNKWNYQDIARSVGVVLGGGAPALLRQLNQAFSTIDRVHGVIQEAKLELEEVIESENDPQQ